MPAGGSLSDGTGRGRFFVVFDNAMSILEKNVAILGKFVVRGKVVTPSSRKLAISYASFDAFTGSEDGKKLADDPQQALPGPGAR
jgi:hypothetical protein